MNNFYMKNMNNIDPNLPRKLEHGIMDGSHDFYFNSATLSDDVGEFTLRTKPTDLTINTAQETETIYRSVEKKRYDLKETLNMVTELLRYIGHNFLCDLSLETEFISGIYGELPKFGDLPGLGELEGFDLNNTITVRPVLISKIYEVSGHAIYNESGSNIPQKLDFKDAKCFVDSTRPLGLNRRHYQFSTDQPFSVTRYPIWVNPKAKGIEKIARVPFNILRDMLEPVTTQRLENKMNGTFNALEELLEEAEYTGEMEHSEGLTEDAKKEGNSHAYKCLMGEKVFAEALTKMWLINNLEKYKLSGDDVYSWRPFPDKRGPNRGAHIFMRKFFKRQRDLVDIYLEG